MFLELNLQLFFIFLRLFQDRFCIQKNLMVLLLRFSFPHFFGWLGSTFRCVILNIQVGYSLAVVSCMKGTFRCFCQCKILVQLSGERYDTSQTAMVFGLGSNRLTASFQALSVLEFLSSIKPLCKHPPIQCEIRIVPIGLVALLSF